MTIDRASIEEHAAKTFGSPEKARCWLLTPHAVFDGKSPAMLLDSEAGRQLVETMLGRLDHGIGA
jgi:putative toxin-antitoxin system antitoxin component (TIGR02293 family)